MPHPALSVHAILNGPREPLTEGMQVGRNLHGTFYYASHHPRLTMTGHDLLDTMRSKPVWDKIKTTAQSKGIELTLDAIKALGGWALKQVIGAS